MISTLLYCWTLTLKDEENFGQQQCGFTETLMQRVSNEQGNDNQKNTYRQNQKEKIEMSWTHNEERWFLKLNPYWVIWEAGEIMEGIDVTNFGDLRLGKERNTAKSSKRYGELLSTQFSRDAIPKRNHA